MKPRVFISSTYYDFKYARERIERFIKGYNFEPVLSERGNVTFEHGKVLDESCYKEVDLCHIMILLIGGRYGHAISKDNITENNEDTSEKEYTSTTKKEFETALKKEIPVFIFIDKNVYAEYKTYKKNQERIEKGNEIDFAHVDSIDVFKFINYIDVNKKKAIKTFDEIEEMENYLSEQIAGWLYLYLEQLQKNQKEEKLLDMVSELKGISERMDIMLNAIGKKSVEEDSCKNIVFEQWEKTIDFFAEQFRNNLVFEYQFSYEDTDLNNMTKEILGICNKTLFDSRFIESYQKRGFYDKMIRMVNEFTKKLLNLSGKLIIAKMNYHKIIR
jgi:hypothetical protein